MPGTKFAISQIEDLENRLSGKKVFLDPRDTTEAIPYIAGAEGEEKIILRYPANTPHSAHVTAYIILPNHGCSAVWNSITSDAIATSLHSDSDIYLDTSTNDPHVYVEGMPTTQLPACIVLSDRITNMQYHTWDTEGPTQDGSYGNGVLKVYPSCCKHGFVLGTRVHIEFEFYRQDYGAGEIDSWTVAGGDATIYKSSDTSGDGWGNSPELDNNDPPRFKRYTHSKNEHIAHYPMPTAADEFATPVAKADGTVVWGYKTHYLDPLTTGIGLTGYVYDATIYTSYTEPEVAVDTIYQYQIQADPLILGWATYSAASAFYTAWDRDPRQLPYIVGTNGERRLICKLKDVHSYNQVAYLVMPNGQSGFFVDTSAEQVITLLMENACKIEIDSSFNIAHLVSVDWTNNISSDMRNFTDQNNVAWDLSRYNSLYNLSPANGYFLEEKRHAIFELYLKPGRLAWTPIDGIALLFKSVNSPDYDGWGNHAQPASNGRIKRYTLSEYQYDTEIARKELVLDNGGIGGLTVSNGTPVIPRGYKTYLFNLATPASLLLADGVWQVGDEITIQTVSTSANILHPSYPIINPAEIPNNMGVEPLYVYAYAGLYTQVGPFSSITMRLTSIGWIVISHTGSIIIDAD